MSALEGPSAPGDRDRSDVLLDHLSEQIINGVLRAGEKLSEPKLARAFGVSRGPMRETMRRLQERNLVTRSMNRGARVREFTTVEYIDLYYIRESLEGMSARLASRRMPEPDIIELRQRILDHIEISKTLPPDTQLPDPLHVDFHTRIAVGSGNAQLCRLLCVDLFAMNRLCWQQHGFIQHRGAKAVTEHLRIVEAIADRDGDLAEMLMRRHIREAREHYEGVRALRADA